MVEEICPKCGLPKELCICDLLDKEAQQQKIQIYTEVRKFHKVMTIVSGVNKEALKSVMKTLKQRIGCGGTVKDDKIELQGDHKARVKQLLVEMGYNQNTIEIL